MKEGNTGGKRILMKRCLLVSKCSTSSTLLILWHIGRLYHLDYTYTYFTMSLRHGELHNVLGLSFDSTRHIGYKTFVQFWILHGCSLEEGGTQKWKGKQKGRRELTKVKRACRLGYLWRTLIRCLFVKKDYYPSNITNPLMSNGF